MKTVSLGSLKVSRIGLGAMGMSAFYTGAGQFDDESIRTIHRALDLGVTHIDTAEAYGPFINEELVGRAVQGRRDEVVLATKFGLISHLGGTAPDSTPANIRLAVEGSLKRLGTDYIDLYYQHRLDPGTPVEETVGALAELVAEGKIATSACRRSAPPRSAVLTPCIRSPRSNPNTPCGPATRKPRSCLSCANWVSASCRTPRLAAAS